MTKADIPASWWRHDLEISTDPARLDVDWVHASLAGTYWATNIPREIVERSIAGSLTFGIYGGARQIGFARVVTDHATFAWIADVFVDPEYRGRGVSVWLMEVIRAHPQLQGLRRWLLATRDAHGLYRKFGFEPLHEPERFMEITLRNPYPLSLDVAAPVGRPVASSPGEDVR